MQKRDLDVVAQLFEVAGDGVDEEFWTNRFQDHIAQAMRNHSGHLRGGGTAVEQQLEVLRARLELHEIVADRLEGRAARVDPGLADACHNLRVANSQIIQQAFEVQGSAGSRTPQSSPRVGYNELGAAARRPSAQGRVSQRAGSPGSLGSPRGAQLNGKGGGVGAFAAASTSTRGSPQSTEFDQLGSPRVGESFGNGGAGRNSQSRGYGSMHTVKIASKSGGVVGRPAKDLQPRQLKEIISSVYASKAQHDQRLQELQEPVETLEQHLYSFLSKRYGIKSVVQDWAQTIFRSIQKFAQRDVEVLVFGKILQNSLSESFATVQDTLRTTVQMLLRNNLQQRHAQRSPSEVEALWRTRQRCGVPLQECEDVVRFMYNERDSAVVLSRLHTLAEEVDEDATCEPDVMKYRDFVQILLTFQMQLTEGFLMDFVGIFKAIDRDNDGIVNGQQLEQLVQQLAVVDDESSCTPEALDALSEQADIMMKKVRSRRRATFSECVEICTGLISARWAASSDEQ